MDTVTELDDLAVVAAAKSPKAQREPKPDPDYARAMGVRAQSMEWHLATLCRYYTLDEVIAIWRKAQA